MIELPNSFKGENFHFVLKADKIDLRDIFPSYYPKAFVQKFKSISNLMISFSNMTSTLNSNESIDFNEIIMKVPIEINNTVYMVPIISFVNNEFSYLRGYLMGFYKKLNKINYFDENKIQFRNEILDVDINLKGEFENSECNLLAFPFLLYRSFNIDNKISAKNFCVLNTSENYEITKKKFIGTFDGNFNFLGKKCEIINIYNNKNMSTINDVSEIEFKDFGLKENILLKKGGIINKCG